MEIRKRRTLGIVGLICIGLGFYLSQHYYQVHFPTADQPQSLCNLSQFWNCDQTALSPLGSILGIPLGAYGALIGLLFLLCSITPIFFLSTLQWVGTVNLLGCLSLGIYSVMSLGGLCPACSIYYLMSAIAFWALGFPKSLPTLPGSSVIGSITAVFLTLFFLWKPAGMNTLEELTPKALQLFANAPEVGDPQTESGYWLHQSHTKFEDAPIRVSIFSDFQCPMCRALKDYLAVAMKPYQDAINVQFYFYPMDDSCNYQIPVGYGPHPLACQASRLAACQKENFVEIHDWIFDHQDDLSIPFLEARAKELDLQDCYHSKVSRQPIKDHLAISQNFNVRGTPLLIINGKEVGGFLPVPYLMAIFKHILANQGNIEKVHLATE